MKPKHKLAYMKCAEAFAECSSATRLKVGSVIVKNNRIISCGYNALPEHINGSCELPDGTTDSRVRHSEKNALIGLTCSAESSQGAELFCTHACCQSCAIDIVDVGIKKVYYRNSYRDDSGIQYLKINNVKTERI
jgi:dCMP deaminase